MQSFLEETTECYACIAIFSAYLPIQARGCSISHMPNLIPTIQLGVRLTGRPLLLGNRRVFGDPEFSQIAAESVYNENYDQLNH